MHQHQAAADTEAPVQTASAAAEQIVRRRRQARMMATAGAWTIVFLAILTVPAPPKAASIAASAAVPVAESGPPIRLVPEDRYVDQAAAMLVRDRLAFPWLMNPAAREKAVRTGTGRRGESPGAIAPVRTAAGAGGTFLPLRLSDEQRRVSRFVSGRYRVKPENAQRYVAYAYRAADEYRLDPYLVLAVMSIESGFNAQARSAAGAQGLMQVLTRVHRDKFEAFGGAAAAFDPVANIAVGARILKEYLVREGSVEGALKSYVGAALLAHDHGYGKKVLTERRRIAAVARGLSASRTMSTRRDDVIRLAMSRAPVAVASAGLIDAGMKPTRID